MTEKELAVVTDVFDDEDFANEEEIVTQGEARGAALRWDGTTGGGSLIDRQTSLNVVYDPVCVFDGSQCVLLPAHWFL